MRVDKLSIVQVDTMPERSSFAPGVLYVSRKYELAIHLCACGCGNETVTPLDEGQWTILYNPDDTVTVRPSIGQRMPCRSHYYITGSTIEWLTPMPA